MSLPKHWQYLAATGRQVLQLTAQAITQFRHINAMQTAGAFAYFALFSLLPLILLSLTCASLFIDREQAATMLIAYLHSYVPLDGDMRSDIFNTVNAVVKARGPASLTAILMLVWAVMQFFSTLINVTRQAWDDSSAQWWRLSLESLIFMGIMLVVLALGVSLPLLVDVLANWLLTDTDWNAWLYPLLGELISALLVFGSLSLFYQLAPAQPTKFAQVWIAAFCTALLFHLAGILFVGYLRVFGNLNPVYGAFSAVMALLLWLYVTGCIFIFGACLCAAPAQRRASAGTGSPVY